MSSSSSESDKDFIRACTFGETLSHTRFHLALRSDAPVVYHRLLLFRVNKPNGSAPEYGEEVHHDEEDNLNGDAELYCMEETCPHLGAPLSLAPIEDIEDTRAIVCPWHKYDFDLKTGASSTGLQACVYEVKIVGKGKNAEIMVEVPHGPKRRWEVVELKGVSEEFADPPVPSLAGLSFCPTDLTALSQSQALHSESELPSTLLGFAHLILSTSAPELKCQLTREAVTRMRAGKLRSIRPSLSEIKRIREKVGLVEIPPREVQLVDPGRVARRGKGGTERSRILMLHALANIEQYAIDLAWDIIARFADVEEGGERLPVEFFLDWAKVAEDEAKHYTLLARRLKELGSYFGAHIAHAGLWDSALETAHSLSSRIAIIHLVAEARGVDMNPITMAKLQAAGDVESTKVLEVIHADEITHVTTGHRWFTWLCQKRGVDPVQTFRKEVSLNFRGKIKGPFNAADRLKAGLTPEFYEDLEGHHNRKNQAVYPDPSTSADGDEHMHPRLI